ncbi:hypothetical protein L226DRAFT_562991 [Lentinus tigrinus ALCF2SS1-7]|uniref:RNase III domain-containing protein n=1 Tax=Lentinus tigrinus ALCF2SS1-6 TaxID=1328759 RepID=A0A5C2RWF6_9APHY|nr:hypothetical protein L227DRAFT_603660 [Lentinus tigrinus ALCF2SS1-6]RPD70140.1 hypothetical protein L226DRAFT_562991 [Lentinus tigrinus ALCF2SS1-7]
MAAQVPPAPMLRGDALLIVFVHYTAPPANDPVFGGCDRLQLLGRSMLRAAYATAVLNRNPDLRGTAFERQTDETLQGFAARWVSAYRWRQFMRAVPPRVNMYDPQETMRILETYAGAVVAQGYPGLAGQAALFGWIQVLVNMS